MAGGFGKHQTTQWSGTGTGRIFDSTENKWNLTTNPREDGRRRKSSSISSFVVVGKMSRRVCSSHFRYLFDKWWPVSKLAPFLILTILPQGRREPFIDESVWNVRLPERVPTRQSIGPFRRNAPGNAKRTWEGPSVSLLSLGPSSCPASCSVLRYWMIALSFVLFPFFSWLLCFITFLPHQRGWNRCLIVRVGFQVVVVVAKFFLSLFLFDRKGGERNRPHPHRLRFFDSSSPSKRREGGYLENKEEVRNTSI